MNTLITSLTLCVKSSVKELINTFNANGIGIVFVLSDDILVGVVTDGDLRRSFLNGCTLDSSIIEVMNTDFFSLTVDTSDDVIASSFTSGIKYIPIVNENNVLIDIATPSKFHRIPIYEPLLCGNELLYTTQCIKDNWISSQGCFVRRFENDFSSLHDSQYSLATCNGTSALHLALLALGIGPGDEVIVPSLTFAATLNAVLYTGAKPVLCDISSSNLALDVDIIKELLTSKTKAIVLVYLYGIVPEISDYLDICSSNSLFLVEDCAESLGCSYKKRPLGTFGHSSAFSFFANKTITTGEGGMVTFKDQNAYLSAATMRDHGMNPNKRYWHDTLGYNYRMTNLQAAVGCAQIESLNTILEKKKFIYSTYHNLLSKYSQFFFFPASSLSAEPISWLVTIVLLPRFDRDLFIRELLSHGIEARPVFYSLDTMPLYSSYRHTSCNYNQSHYVSNYGVSLPSSPNLDYAQIEFVASIISAFFLNCI